jgi:hypothetical protein
LFYDIVIVWYLFLIFAENLVMKDLFNKNISKGGLIGALMGSVASTQLYKKDDTLTKKAIKTGIFASVGYFLGSLFERKYSKSNQR